MKSFLKGRPAGTLCPTWNKVSTSLGPDFVGDSGTNRALGADNLPSNSNLLLMQWVTGGWFLILSELHQQNRDQNICLQGYGNDLWPQCPASNNTQKIGISFPDWKTNRPSLSEEHQAVRYARPSGAGAPGGCGCREGTATSHCGPQTQQACCLHVRNNPVWGSQTVPIFQVMKVGLRSIKLPAQGQVAP